LDYCRDASPLVAIQQEYGFAAVSLITLIAQKKEDGAVLVWSDEMLEATVENRQKVREMLSRLSGCTLIARYPTGPAIKGPLVALPFEEVSERGAMWATLHPALYDRIVSMWPDDWIEMLVHSMSAPGAC
jgi:hypothetical protein